PNGGTGELFGGASTAGVSQRRVPAYGNAGASGQRITCRRSAERRHAVVDAMRTTARRALDGAVATLAFIGSWTSSASAETIQSALVKAYQNNPQLNAQRAAVRAIDETVPQALSGYRPQIGRASCRERVETPA